MRPHAEDGVATASKRAGASTGQAQEDGGRGRGAAGEEDSEEEMNPEVALVFAGVVRPLQVITTGDRRRLFSTTETETC
jgi:hypothetical protein